MTQQNLPLGDGSFPPRRHVKPLVRWVGGKRDTAKLISDVVYLHLQRTRGRYFEPFLGGGAVALDLGLPDMVLSDVCEELVHAYMQARQHPQAVAHALQNYASRGTDREAYLRVRASIPSSHIMRAARFFYLNALCFNGVYRVNSQGIFNVPYGARTRKGSTATQSVRSLDEFVRFAEATRDSHLLCASYDKILPEAGEGDFIYADPPYYGTFDSYDAGGFSHDDHVALADALRGAYDRGADVLLTNSDTPEVREMYSWAAIFVTEEKRRVNRDATKRGRVGCLIAATTPDLIGREVGP